MVRLSAAVEPTAIGGVELSGGLASLKQLIEEDNTVETLPELFAFGLLAEFDVRHLVALVAPHSVALRERSERASREFAPLQSWYALLGATFKLAP